MLYASYMLALCGAHVFVSVAERDTGEPWKSAASEFKNGKQTRKRASSPTSPSHSLNVAVADMEKLTTAEQLNHFVDSHDNFLFDCDGSS